MKMNLFCPRCAFGFSAIIPDFVSEETKKEIMTCPCGTMMIKVDYMPAIVLKDVVIWENSITGEKSWGWYDNANPPVKMEKEEE